MLVLVFDADREGAVPGRVVDDQDLTLVLIENGSRYAL
jgi:hypothetical protein